LAPSVISWRHQPVALITPSAWGSQLTGYNHHHQLHASHQVFSGAVAGEEKEDFCKGSFSHAQPLLCFKFCFTLFFLALFYIKNPKKLESLIVVFT
jgi:hypothetical protein